MKYLLFLLFSFISITGQSQSSDYLINVERGTLYSEVLEMEKSYQVFLPESYQYSKASTYPVVYLVDGDYNFHYQTGLIEMLSNISEKIPEVIVVGISDNGNAGYRQDCTMKTKTNPTGNTRNFINYLETELKPKIQSQYQASTFDVLIGHSLGGLFATNVLLEKPELFDAYLAIDPSYWWDGQLIVATADSLFKAKEDIPASLFVTLAGDSKQMGVHEFIGGLETKFPASKNLTFKYYEGESHGSVGVPSVRDGLLNIFSDWEMKRAQFYELGTATNIVNYYRDYSKKYQGITRIPPLLFSNIIYYFFRNEQPAELKIIEDAVNQEFPASKDDFYAKLGSYLIETEKYSEAEDILSKSIKANPKAYKSYDTISKLHHAKGATESALKYAERAVALGKELKVRQWQLNELESNLAMLKAKK